METSSQDRVDRDAGRPVVVGLRHDNPALLAAAEELARTFDAPLRVVHTYSASASSADLYRGRDAQVVTRALAGQVLDRARQRLATTDVVNVRYVLKLATAAKGLEAESLTSRLLVVGAAEPTWVGRLTAGHLVRRVATHARCPVVVVPDVEPAAGGDVLVAVDIDNIHQEALRFAADLAQRWGTPLRVVSALQPGLVGPGREHQHARLDRAVHPFRRPGLEVSTHVVAAEAGHAVAHATHAARMVVVGRPNQPHRGPLLSRSVAASLVAGAPCAVTVVPVAPRP